MQWMEEGSLTIKYEARAQGLGTREQETLRKLLISRIRRRIYPFRIRKCGVDGIHTAGAGFGIMAENPIHKPRSFISFWGHGFKKAFKKTWDKYGILLICFGIVYMGVASYIAKTKPLGDWVKAKEIDMSLWVTLIIPSIIVVPFLAYHLARAPYEIYKEQWTCNESLRNQLEDLKLKQSEKNVVGYFLSQLENRINHIAHMNDEDYARNHLRHYLAVPLQHPEHNRLASRPASKRPVPFAANKGFVSLDGVKQRKLPVNHLHVFPDKASHAPRGLVGHAKLPFQFFGRDAMPGRCEQVNGVKPKLKRRAAVLKRGAHCRVQMMPAKLAGIRPLCLNPEPLGLPGAFRTGMVLAKTGFKQMLKANFIIREPRHELTNRNAGGLFLAVLIFHAPKIAHNPTYVKGIIPSDESRAGNNGQCWAVGW
jgi:hypothetical protein